MSSAPKLTTSKVPYHLRPYIRVLGEDLAVQLFLTFGGSAVYLSERPQDRSQLRTLLSAEQIRGLLFAMRGEPNIRIPTAKPFIACQLRANGMPVAEIARTLHVADWTVRRWANQEDDCDPSSAGQPDLFG